MEMIKAWLNGSRNYAMGVKLYVQHGDEPLLKKLFISEGETPYKRERLEIALNELFRDSKPSTADNTSPDYTPKKQFEKQWRADDLKDDIEKSLWQQYRLKHKEMDDLRSQLLHFSSVEECREAAFKILRLDEELDEVIYCRNFYKEHGRLPETEQVQYITDPFLMADRMSNLKRYIRREKQALEKDSGNTAAACRKKEFVDELNHYLNKLGKPLYDDKTG